VKGSKHPRAGINLAFGGGMAAIVLYVVCSMAAWWVYPNRFTPLKNWLSDLGDRSRNPQGAPFYNVGCILTAAALLLFVLGLSRWRSEHRRRNALIVASQLAAFGSIVFLVMLGLYSQERLHEHLIYSNWFFVCFSLFMALLSAALITDPHFKKSVGILGFAVVLVSFAFHSLFPLSRPLEWMTEFGFLVYVALVALSTQRALTIGSSRPPMPGARMRSTGLV
jgi:hypothetical membrane protein